MDFVDNRKEGSINVQDKMGFTVENYNYIGKESCNKDH